MASIEFVEFTVTWGSYAPEKLLEERFSITTGFHPGQRDILEQLVQGKRILAIQRTSWGKSLCYQMASLYYPDLTVVFSPLKALMRDACQRCNNAYAIPSAIVSSDFTQNENQATLERAVAGDLKLLFIAPERLSNALWQEYASRMRISMVVIDEAHCISTWGYDFRPAYRRIVQFLYLLPAATPVLALTATANERVEKDILGQIGDARVIRGTMYRPNLYLNVVRVCGDWEKLCYLETVLAGRSDTGIVYTATKRSAEMVAMFLRARGINADYYHAGREDDVRQRVEQKLMANAYNVVCSTTALGMGIDKPDVRFVLHYHIPDSPISYYQEMGRAGRDGKVAWCVLLYDPADATIQEHMMSNDKPEEKYYEAIWSLLKTAFQGLSEYDIMLHTGLSDIVVRTVVADLEEQGFIEFDATQRRYTTCTELSYASAGQENGVSSSVDLAVRNVIQLQKLQELRDIQSYAQVQLCYMRYLTEYLGEQNAYQCGVCGNCRREHFPLIVPPVRIQESVTSFLDEEYLPCIEKCSVENVPVHEAGWALSYHGRSRIGKLVAMSKYENGGPFALSLVLRAVEVVRTRYPMQALQGVVSVPPTSGSMLVEMFARQVADMLGIEYLPVIVKTRVTRKQKSLTNRVQKAENVKDAFAVSFPSSVSGRVLLLIDDIYDSSYTLREVGKTLMQAGAYAVYPLTITRTAHSDDR